MIAVTTKKFTVEEYHRLGELGFFNENARVELIRGEIVEMPTKKTPHSVCNTKLWRQLFKLLDDQVEIRVQEPIILPYNSEPQPDVAIVKNKEDNYLSSHPQPDDILFLIEISDSTLKYDQETKLTLYAEYKISHYWLFNLIYQQLEIYSKPYQNFYSEAGYCFKQIAFPNEVVKLPYFEDLSLDLSLIFPNFK